MKMDFWEKTNYTDGVPETYTKQLREKKMCDFWVYMPFNLRFYGSTLERSVNQKKLKFLQLLNVALTRVGLHRNKIVRRFL